MKKMSLKVHHLFFVTGCFFSFNSFAQFDSYPGIKCPKLFSDIEAYSPGNGPKSKDFELYSNIKLIVPSLGDYQSSQELSDIHKSQMKDYKTMLLGKGYTEDLIKKTRLERFKLAGKLVDAFVFPDGIVHHVSNPFQELSSNALISVRDCRLNNKELNCVDEKTNLVKDGFCQVNKDPDMLPLGPNCGSDFVDEYLVQHNCLVTSDMESCGELGMLPTGALGAIGGLGGVLYASKKPDFLEGVKKLKSLQDAIPEFENEVKVMRDQVLDELKEKRAKFIDSQIKKYKNEPQVVRQLESMKANHRSYDYYYDSMDYSNQKSNNQIAKDLSKFFEENSTPRIVDKIKKSSNVIAKHLDAIQIKVFARHSSSLKYFITDEISLGKLFGDDYSSAKKFAKTTYDQAERLYLQRAPADEVAAIAKYKEADKTGNTSSLDNNSYQLKNRALSQIRQLRDKMAEPQLSKLSPEVRALYEKHLTRYSFNTFDLENFRTLNLSELQSSRLKRRPAMLRRAGLIGAFSGAATEAALNLRNKSELKNCAKRFSLSDKEIDFINNEGVFLGASRIKSTQYMNACDSIYIDDPETTIAEAIELFGGIPNGMCNMLWDRKKKLETSLTKSFSTVAGSCTSAEVTTNDLTLKHDPDGQVISDIKISRPEGNFIYSTPINGPESFPDFKSVKVYRIKDNGEKELDAKYTQDFKNFFATVVPASQIIDLTSGLEDEEVKDHAKIRVERQKRYNAYMNQIYRSFSESCKGYNNIECDVFGKAQNITPMLMVSRSVCGENKFSPKGLPTKRDPQSTLPR